MPCTLEVIDSASLRGQPTKWVLYTEKAHKKGAPVVYSRNGPHSTTQTFGSLDQARRFVEQHALTSKPDLRLVRIFRLPAPAP